MPAMKIQIPTTTQVETPDKEKAPSQAAVTA